MHCRMPHLRWRPEVSSLLLLGHLEEEHEAGAFTGTATSLVDLLHEVAAAQPQPQPRDPASASPLRREDLKVVDRGGAAKSSTTGAAQLNL